MVEIKVTVDNIDYEALLEVLIPLIRDKVKDKSDLGVLAGLFSDSAFTQKLAKAALKAMSQEKKDELAAALIRKYGVTIAQKLLEESAAKDVKMDIRSIDAVRWE